MTKQRSSSLQVSAAPKRLGATSAPGALFPPFRRPDMESRRRDPYSVHGSSPNAGESSKSVQFVDPGMPLSQEPIAYDLTMFVVQSSGIRKKAPVEANVELRQTPDEGRTSSTGVSRRILAHFAGVKKVWGKQKQIPEATNNPDHAIPRVRREIREPDSSARSTSTGSGSGSGELTYSQSRSSRSSFGTTIASSGDVYHKNLKAAAGRSLRAEELLQAIPLSAAAEGLPPRMWSLPTAGLDAGLIGDADGRTPLSSVAEIDPSAAIEALMKREGVDPNLVNEAGRTSLSLAAEWGDSTIVQALLKYETMDSNMTDKHSRTPISWAAIKSGNTRTMELLLKHKGLDANLADKDGRTPLSWAAGMGHGTAVWALLACNDVDPNLADSLGQTPLSHAAKSGKDRVVQVLLHCKRVNANLMDIHGRTPLHHAAEYGHVVVVQMLMKLWVWTPAFIWPTR